MKRDLEGVKAGDTIKVSSRYDSGWVLHTVQRVTDTRAVCERESFMISSGMQIGTRTTGRFSFARYGTLVNETDVVALKAEAALRTRISEANRQVDRLTVTAANLEAAEAFISASQPKEPS